MIPEAAVEAAYAAINYPDQRAIDHDEILAILEAAAPHMMADAFEQGQTSGMRHADRLRVAADMGRPDLPGPLSPNPYR